MYFPDRGVYTPYSPCMSTPLACFGFVVELVHSMLYNKSAQVESESEHVCMLTQDGNDFGDQFDNMKFVAKQVLMVHLQVERSHILFSPPLPDCRQIVYECFVEIISAGSNISRVSLSALFFNTVDFVKKRTFIFVIFFIIVLA